MNARGTGAGRLGAGLLALAAAAAVALLLALRSAPDARERSGAAPDAAAPGETRTEGVDAVRLGRAQPTADGDDVAEAVAPEESTSQAAHAYEAPSDPFARWLQGRYDEAIAGFRKELAATTDPELRLYRQDRQVVAVLEHGAPSEVAATTAEWLTDLCWETMDAAQQEIRTRRWYSIWFQASAAHPTACLEGRLGNAVHNLRLESGPWSDRFATFRACLERARREANAKDAALLDGVLAFERLSAPYAPSIAPTADAVARTILPQVRSFVDAYADAEEPTLQIMAAWLRRRYAMWLTSPREDEAGR